MCEFQRKFTQCVSSALESLEQGIEEARQISIGANKLVIGYFDIRELVDIAGFMQENPDIRIEIVNLSNEQLDDIYEDVRHSRIDILSGERTHLMEQYELVFVPTRQEHLVAMCLDSHPLAGKSEVTTAELAPYPLYFDTRGEVLREFFSQSDISFDAHPISITDGNTLYRTLLHGALFVGEASYFQKEYSFKSILLSDSPDITFGVIYAPHTPNAQVGKYLAYIQDPNAQVGKYPAYIQEQERAQLTALSLRTHPTDV